MTVFFGERWDAPRVDHATQGVTPIGRACLHCREPIRAGDRGVWVSYVDEVEGRPVVGTAPAHMECDLRMALGTVEHLEGQCTCHHPATEDRPVLSFRQQAMATLAWINAQRARGGMGAL